ncbi:MAG TPA: flagellar motor stator protein MotA [Syntrophobacteraceae bacterium]|nr:flagellar motor stator protein MotA [Syntrophobacteraceae bacterium]
MFIFIGFTIVLGSVIGGYLMEQGNLNLLIQPAELVIIFGAAIGGFLISSPMKVIRAVQGGFLRMFRSRAYSRRDYIDALVLLSEIFYKIRKEGLVSIEGDLDEPEKSLIFQKYPTFLRNHHAMAFLTDTLRTLTITDIEAHELGSLLDYEIEAHYEGAIIPAKSIASVADSLPGLGIVAAVLGVVLTMKKISEPPEVLGHSIGAALVGTFLGVLLCYGFVGPMSRNLEHIANEDREFLTVTKAALLAFVNTPSPQVAIEFARRVVPDELRPSFLELEALVKQARKK